MLATNNLESHNQYEQVCYVPCKFCDIVLAVCVPWRSLSETVTIKCGHCNNLWSVIMAENNNQSTSSSLRTQDFQLTEKQAMPELKIGPSGFSAKYSNKRSSSSSSSSSRSSTPTTTTTEQRVVNQPPPKKHRGPSAYNKFIREEIQRIKASKVNITHREAFSTAAKNWAHYQVLELMGDSKKKAVSVDEESQDTTDR